MDGELGGAFPSIPMELPQPHIGRNMARGCLVRRVINFKTKKQVLRMVFLPSQSTFSSHGIVQC